jgi:pilus assembly protein Flp/PilA
MFLVLNKKLLTPDATARLSSAVSREPLGSPFQTDCLNDIFNWFRVDIEKQFCFGLIIIRREIVKDKVLAFLRDEDGLTIVEYAVAAGLITATVAGTFLALGGTVEGIIAAINGYLGG